MTNLRCSFLNPKSRDNLRKRLLAYAKEHYVGLVKYAYVNSRSMAAHLLGVSERTIRRVINGEPVSCQTCVKIMIEIGKKR